ncbi:hypothetical protein M3Y94_00256500 [Aphelenchoides besseyi]|nr:hypothetical protein M3Y94_00256500 [Aphelenchoides besseyi]
MPRLFAKSNSPVLFLIYTLLGPQSALASRYTNLFPIFSKANTLKRVVPNDEAIVYSECERSARTVSQLARCVVGLLDVRDRNEVEQTNESEPRTQKEFYERITKFINDVLDSSKRDNILSKIRRKKRQQKLLLKTCKQFVDTLI